MDTASWIAHTATLRYSVMGTGMEMAIHAASTGVGERLHVECVFGRSVPGRPCGEPCGGGSLASGIQIHFRTVVKTPIVPAVFSLV